MENTKKVEDDTRNWSDLHLDLLILVARKIQYTDDYRAFHAVCTLWRLAASRTSFNGTPSLLVKLKGDRDDAKFTCYKFDYIHGCNSTMSIPFKMRVNRLLGSWRGWILISETYDNQMSLFHVISKTHIILPHTRSRDTKKVVLSSSPLKTSNYTIVIIEKSRKIAYWRLGNKSFITKQFSDYIIHDVIYYKGFFYVITKCCSIIVFDVTGPAWVIVKKIPFQFGNHILPIHRIMYLVESTGDLLVVARVSAEDNDNLMKFRVFIVEDDVWREINNLGNRAIFVGLNASFSYACETSGCRPNCIYYTDDCGLDYYIHGKKHNMGVYNLTSEKVEYSCNSKNSRQLHCTSPLWLTPSYY